MGRKKEKASEVRDSRKKKKKPSQKEAGEGRKSVDHAERKAGWKMDEWFECLQPWAAESAEEDRCAEGI